MEKVDAWVILLGGVLTVVTGVISLFLVLSSLNTFGVGNWPLLTAPAATLPFGMIATGGALNKAFGARRG